MYFGGAYFCQSYYSGFVLAIGEISRRWVHLIKPTKTWTALSKPATPLWTAIDKPTTTIWRNQERVVF